jgi:hypothetical protein
MSKFNNVCIYCGAKSQANKICSTCSIKLKLVRKLKRILRSVPYESKAK